MKDKDDFYTTEEYPLIEWIKENVSDSWMLIDALNHDASISEFLNPTERIHRIIARHKNGEKIS